MALDSATCSICSAFLGLSKTTKVTEVAEFLKALLQTDVKLLKEPLIICDTCLINVKAACKFKASYLENSQKLCIKQENVENGTVCEICKEIVNPIDCIPMFYAVAESDKLILLKFLSSELGLKSHDSPQTCELCHKSMLNFCIVIKSFPFVLKDIFHEDVTDLKSIIKSDIGQDINVDSADSTDDYKLDIKKEDVEVKEEQESATTYDDFLCKNEELDLKTDDEPIWSYQNEDESFKCLTCDYQTQQQININRHMLEHQPSNGIKMLKCNFCDYQTKNKHYLKNHVIVHKNSTEIEMFKCSICDYQTKYKYNLGKHLLVHKKNSEIQMYKCQICNYQTEYEFRLKRHLVIHETKLLKCHICNFQICREKFEKHIIMHKVSNEIPMFNCQNCSFQTNNKYYFKRHLNVHKNSGSTVK